jgi:branched-chain amino acid transport system permease protein
MDILPVQLILIALWLGAGIYGTLLLLQKGYKIGWLKRLSYYAAPVVVLFYVIMSLVQPIDASWPGNLPGSLANILLLALLITISPGLLVAAFFVPRLDTSSASLLAIQQEKLGRLRGWLLLAGTMLVALVLPLIALSLFKGAPRYDSVLGVFLNGLLTGLLFSLIALGYTLVYGIVELVNFAHGDVFMLASFTGYVVLTSFLGVQSGRPVKADTPFVVVILAIFAALLIGMLVCGSLNFIINRLAYRPLRNAPRLAPMISAIGVSFILQNIGLYLNGSIPKGYPILFPNDTFPKRSRNTDIVLDWIGANDSVLTFPVTAVLVIVGAGLLLLGLSYLINKTRMGKAMRAVAQNREAAALMGISIERTISLAFVIGGALAGAAGVIYGIYQVQGSVKYNLGFESGLFAFTAAVLGGIGNVNGAVLGGIFIGMIYSLCQSSVFGLTSSYLALSGWASVSVFLVLVLVMVFKPTGILGDITQEKV